jgi:TATA-box binding protein (TBP) (component of TFIID and TFIIIB)
MYSKSTRNAYCKYSTKVHEREASMNVYRSSSMKVYGSSSMKVYRSSSMKVYSSMRQKCTSLHEGEARV